MDELYFRLIAEAIVMTVVFLLQALQSKVPSPQTRQCSIKPFFLSLAVAILLCLQIIGLNILPMRLPFMWDQIVRWTGLVILAIGASFVVSSRLMSGRRNVWGGPLRWPHEIPNHQLVTWGPYRIVRHPFYAGVIWAMIGFELAFATWLVIVAVPITLYMVLGILEEEKKVRADYPVEYDAYMQRTRWRIVPSIY